jgi:hypothetical protein
MRAICPKQSTLKTVRLKCKICGKLFYTKNIEYIGARSIFPDKEDCAHEIDDLELIEPKEIDIESFKEELELFHSQKRSYQDIERLFTMSYNKTPKELGLENKGKVDQEMLKEEKRIIRISEK